MIMLGGVLILVIANTINYSFDQPYWTVTRIIHLGYDNNLPAWYSSLLLAIAALLAYGCYLIATESRISGSRIFAVFALFLLFLSSDEIVDFHGIFGDLAARYVGIYDPDIPRSAQKEFAAHSRWAYVGGPVIIVIFGSFLFYLKKIFNQVPGSFLYVILGFVTIVVGGIFLEISTNWLNHEELEWLWRIEIVVEDSLEMIGTLLICYSLIIWRDGVANAESVK